MNVLLDVLVAACLVTGGLLSVVAGIASIRSGSGSPTVTVVPPRPVAA